MDSANYHSGSSRYSHESKLSSRSGYREPIEKDDVEELTARTLNLNLKPSSNISHYKRLFIEIINPLLLTTLSAFVRLYMIDASKYVVWDEAHFGKFGSYYLKREFYFDVHPPLGKLLVALSGYIADYDGSFAFDSGLEYPDNCNYVLMRAFNCLFGILCTPVVYKTAAALGFSQFTVWLISLMTIFEMISLTLSKFILLDSMLLFFTVLSYYFLVKLHNLRTQNKLLTTRGITTMVMTGVSIGCVCSVKWVGLFVTILIGFYVIYDLLIKFYQLTSTNSISFMKYICHWLSRIICLIIVPFVIYLACFKVHFTVLNHSGSGDGSISTLLQASLEGNLVLGGPRSVGFGSMVTLRSQGLSPNLLHSHPHLYPEGSRQQQITTYGFKDENNNFLIEFDLESGLRGEFATQEPLENDTYSLTRLVKNGDTVRLVHDKSDCLLHSHPIPAFVLKSQYEVSCYADLEQSDSKDEWIIEVQLQEISPSPAFKDEDPNLIHPISTNFRLRHKVLGCYLATTGYSLPSWGYQQGEVICKRSFMLKDKSTWWNIEDHVNDKLPEPEVKYVPPKPKFWKEFVLLNYGMMASNNALVPDPDKFDRLSSEWWEWPIDHSGLRMCSWGADDVKYFLIGHPFINWFSTAALGLFLIYAAYVAFRWQRQQIPMRTLDSTWESFLIQGIVPFLGWILHFVPFILMGRVTYLHHYVPALYFAILTSGFVVERLIHNVAHRYISYVIYSLLYIAVVYGFWYFKDLALGMHGPAVNFRYLKVLDSWMI